MVLRDVRAVDLILTAGVLEPLRDPVVVGRDPASDSVSVPSNGIESVGYVRCSCLAPTLRDCSRPHRLLSTPCAT